MQGADATSQTYTLTPLSETYALQQSLFRAGNEDVFLVYTEGKFEQIKPFVY